MQQVWLNHMFYQHNLKTNDGKSVDIVSFGTPNSDAGPDFFNGVICINDEPISTVSDDGVGYPLRFYLSGNIELHLTSDDWYRHNHHKDPAYDNVILHVVAKSTGREIRDSKGTKIDEIEIKFPTNMEFPAETKKCAKMFRFATDELKQSWLERMFRERMEQFADRVKNYQVYSGGDWDQTFFTLLARSMGGSVNSEAMEMLARRTPVKIIFKQQDLLQSEALLLGQAGFFTNFTPTDDYEKKLVREYEFLKAKYDLTPLNKSVWKFLRMRPDNFPEFRLVELAGIVTATAGNFLSDYYTDDVKQLEEKLDSEPSTYWRTHYSLGKTTKQEKSRTLSKSQKNLVIINAVAPFMYAYSKRYGRATSARDEGDLEQVRSLLKKLPIEKNRLIDEWQRVGLTPKDEAEAQALIYLSKQYCKFSKCFLCNFGRELVGKTCTISETETVE